MGRIALEVCVDSAAGVEAAVNGGADRLELCAALPLGGLTPSVALLALVADCPIPVMAMSRPRAGDFCWSPIERRSICIEIAQMRNAGVAGVVIGASMSDGRLDVAALADMIAAAEGMDITLHRAIDLVPDIDAAMRACVALGIRRVLSSGGEAKATGGMERLISMANYGVSVMPGGGVSADNAGQFAERLPFLSEIHASCSTPISAATHSKVKALGFQLAGARVTDAAVVRQLRSVLDQMAARPAG